MLLPKSLLDSIVANTTRLAALALTYLAFNASISGAPQLRLFSHLGTDDGLSESWVRTISQDSLGFVWLGTKDGLNRYDRNQFRVYRPDTDNVRGLASGSINQIYVDRTGSMWVCTLGGAFRYDQARDQFSLFEATGTRTINAMLEARNGIYWFASNDGLWKYEPEKEKLSLYEHSPGNSGLSTNIVWKLFEDANGTLWVGTEGGLNRYDASLDSFPSLEASTPKVLSHSPVRDLVGDSFGALWIATDSGLYAGTQSPNSAMRFKIAQKTRPYRLACDEENQLWIGRAGGLGLEVVDLDAFHANGAWESAQYRSSSEREGALASNSVESVFVDRTGDVWIGTYDNGTSHYSSQGKPFINQRPSDLNPRLSDQVNAILEDEHIQWIGTEHGLARIDLESGNTRVYLHESDKTNSLGSDTVYSLFKDSRGNLWAGCWAGGLNRYDEENDAFVTYLHNGEDERSLSNDNVFSIFEDSRGQLWIGTVGGGLNRFVYETNDFERWTHEPENPNSLFSPYVNDIAEGADGSLWISTYSALDRFNPESKTFEHFSHTGSDDLYRNRGDLETIHLDPLGRLWLGTEVGLLNFNPNSKEYRRYNVSHGLPRNSIKSITQDSEGGLWLGTNSGLSHFPNAMSLPANPTIINYDQQDGLLSDIYIKRSVFESANGELLFGSKGGMVRFEPSSIQPDQTEIPVVITDFFILNERVSPNDKFELLPVETYLIDQLKIGHQHSVFGFRFTSLIYPRSDSVEYVYRLQGFDTEWREAKDTQTAYYTNIDPGNYVFEVKASNEDGVWGSASTTLPIVIPPPWWMSVWFRGGIAVAFVSGLFGIYFSRINTLKQSRRLLEEKVDERTGELKAAKEALSNQNLELIQHRKHLEKLVSDRTRELMKAKEKAEESDRLKSAFLANMSHEIRTPLNAIMGFSNLISTEAEGNGEYEEYSQRINENTEMLTQLLDDILDLSVIESNQLELYSEKIDIHSFFQELTYECRHLVRARAKKGVAFSTESELPESLKLCIVSDPVRLRQILLNFVTNACKFTESGSICLRAKYSSNDDRVDFEVEDTGIGIKPENQEAVFDRFYKVREKSRRFEQGTGLGLAICKRLATELNFDISLQSEYGRGSVFKLSLQTTSDACSEPSDPQLIMQETPAQYDFRDFTFLVAEDVDSNFQVIDRFLQRTGVKVVRASNGREAVEIYRRQGPRFDLLLLDIAMPELDGVECLREIKSIGLKVPAVAVTAHAMHQDKELLLRNGFSDVIAKPIARDALMSGIARQLIIA